jgi:hypothetical protein
VASAGETAAGFVVAVEADWVWAVPERASRRAQSRVRVMKFLGEDEYKVGNEAGGITRCANPQAVWGAVAFVLAFLACHPRRGSAVASAAALGVLLPLPLR